MQTSYNHTQFRPKKEDEKGAKNYPRIKKTLLVVREL
jgi:hypothetical protein